MEVNLFLLLQIFGGPLLGGKMRLLRQLLGLSLHRLGLLLNLGLGDGYRGSRLSGQLLLLVGLLLLLGLLSLVLRHIQI